MIVNTTELTEQQFDLYEVLCPDCKTWSPLRKWDEIDVFCEICGGHSAYICPNSDCFYMIDSMEKPEIEARLKE